MRQKLGKRKRRALIRLRHALSREAFIRWARQTDNLLATRITPHWRSREWHAKTESV
jgi:hypothetical protein